jgi:drug/metabolite transporter (DMT)-like permease
VPKDNINLNLRGKYKGEFFMRLYGSLILLSLIWGLSFVFIEDLIDIAGVWGTVFLRCLAGAFILLPFFVIHMKKSKVTQSVSWKAIVVVGIFNAGLPWGLIALSQTNITSNTAAVLNALTPIFTGLIGFCFFSVILNKRQWGGIFLGFVGILVLMDFNVNELLSENFVGIGTMILATTCYGFGSQFTRKYLQGVNVLVLTTLSLLVGAIVGGIGIVLTNHTLFVELIESIDLLFIVSVIGLGCFGSGIAHLLFYYLINNGGAEFASTVTYLVPLTALFWGSVLLGESITKNLIIGLIVIFSGVFLAKQKKGRK